MNVDSSQEDSDLHTPVWGLVWAGLGLSFPLAVGGIRALKLVSVLVGTSVGAVAASRVQKWSVLMRSVLVALGFGAWLALTACATREGIPNVVNGHLEDFCLVVTLLAWSAGVCSIVPRRFITVRRGVSALVTTIGCLGPIVYGDLTSNHPARGEGAAAFLFLGWLYFAPLGIAAVPPRRSDSDWLAMQWRRLVYREGVPIQRSG